MEPIDPLGKWILAMFFLVCSAMALMMVVKPAAFTELTLKSNRWWFGLLGYEVQFKPLAPGRPESFARMWGIFSVVMFMVLLILVLLTPTASPR